MGENADCGSLNWGFWGVGSGGTAQCRMLKGGIRYRPMGLCRDMAGREGGASTFLSNGGSAAWGGVGVGGV